HTQTHTHSHTHTHTHKHTNTHTHTHTPGALPSCLAIAHVIQLTANQGLEGVADESSQELDMELEWGNRMQGVKDGAFEPRGERWAARRRCPLLQLQIGPANKAHCKIGSAHVDTP